MMKSREIACEGMRWNCHDDGRRPGAKTLVFLPGTLGSVDIFREQVKTFGEDWRVVLLGYPGSSDVAGMSASFWALLAMLEVERPFLVGSSLGAYLLQHFTSESDHAVRGLFLGNTFVDSHRLRFLRSFDPAFIDEASPQEVKRLWLAFVDSLPSVELKAALMPMVRDQQSDAELYGRSLAIAHLGPVATSVVPPGKITILSCLDDPVCKPETVDEVVSRYPGARHVALSSGAHYPHLINSNAYDESLRDALSRA